MIVALTGHRPPRGGLTWNHNNDGDITAVTAVREHLRITQPELVNVGGALGFDTLGARACWLEHIPYKVYVPFTGQANRWPPAAQERYQKMLDAAAEVVVLYDEPYHPTFMQIRNIVMIRDSEAVWAWWDGKRSGGTWKAIEWAKTRAIPVTNLYTPHTNSTTQGVLL
jgi:uncharacterized phage-like protein YoqJ